MSAAPAWRPVDRDTAAVLSLVADLDHPSVDREWVTYLDALKVAALADSGLVYPNVLRPLVRGRVAPKRIGAFVSAAKSRGILAHAVDRATGAPMWEVSDDTEGRNGGRPAAVYALNHAALDRAYAKAGAPAPKPAPAPAAPVWDRDPQPGGLF